jgi:hypothetical protein
MTSGSPTDVLDRAFPAPSDAFDRLVQLRERRRRTRRIAAGAVTMVAVAIVVRRSWVVAGDRVYQPSSDGRLVGYATSCAADPCRPDWIGAAAGDLTTASPVAADGFVFVGSDECCHGSRPFGHLFAFSASCATFPTPCRPVWKATLADGFFGGQPVIVDGHIYVGSSDGTVYAFPTTCAAVRGRCEAVWTARTHGRIAAKVGFGIVTQIVTPARRVRVVPLRRFGIVVVCLPAFVRRVAMRPDVDRPHRRLDQRHRGRRSVRLRLGGGAPPVRRTRVPGSHFMFPTRCSHGCSAAWNFGTTRSARPSPVGWCIWSGPEAPVTRRSMRLACGCRPAARRGGRCRPTTGERSTSVRSPKTPCTWAAGTATCTCSGAVAGATCCDAGAPSEGRWLAYVIYAVVIGGLGLLVVRRRVASRSTG